MKSRKEAVEEMEAIEAVESLKASEADEKSELTEGEVSPEEERSSPQWRKLVSVPRKDPIQSGHEGDTKWTKFKGLFKGTEYEQFIQQSGLELKNLYLSYLNEYFNDIEDEGIDIETLKGKYINFIELYYNEAIQKDKQLIENVDIIIQMSLM